MCYQVTFKHTDQYDRTKPFHEWTFIVDYDGRGCREGDGSESIEVEIINIGLLSAVSFCNGWGTNLRFNAEYYREINVRMRTKLNTSTDGMRATVEAKCRQHFEQFAVVDRNP